MPQIDLTDSQHIALEHMRDFLADLLDCRRDMPCGQSREQPCHGAACSCADITKHLAIAATPFL